MAQNYTRQSSFADGDTITASLFNNEFNQVVNAFSYSASSDSSTGHKHDGTAGQGGNIPKIGDIDFLNKIVVDSTNNRWGIFVEVAGGPVEQVRIQDGAIVPVTTNDIDLGTGALQFKDIFIDGTANIDSLVLSSGSTVTAILDEDDLVSDSATALATQQSIKAYVDAQVTAQDLDIVGDTGTDAIDLDSETLTFTGGTGITSVVTAGTVTHNIDSTVATLTGTQTLTNKTITSPDIDGGTVDGADITVGAAKTLDVSAGTLTLADNQISGDKVEGGTIAAITITAMTGTLQTAAQPNVTSLGTIASLVATTADINGGTIDGTTLGATTPASVAATTGTFSGAVTATGTSVFASLDISGDIDVDGTTNLDVVDIDGAVDMASTLTVGSTISINEPAQTTYGLVSKVKSVYLSSTDATYANLTIRKEAATSTDYLQIRDSGNALLANLTSLGGLITAPTAGGHAVFNEDGVDADFRVESDTNTHALFVQGSDGNVGIGTSSPGTTLDVIGPLRSNVSGGTPIVYLSNGTTQHSIQNTSDALTFFNNGTEHFRIALDGSLSTPTLGTSNVRFGVNAGNSIIAGGNYNTVVGDEAGTAITTGDNNVLIGAFTGDALTTGTFNVAVGTSALGSDILGNRSVAVGNNALTTQNPASAVDMYNVAVGYSAGAAVTTGTNNTLIGGLAGDAITTASYNTAVGYGALTTATVGYGTAVGFRAGLSTTTGIQNVFIGSDAGGLNTTGTRNTFVGPDAGYYVTTGSANTIIGKFNGNQGGLDIRTASNHIVLSDGDGNPRAYWDAAGALTTGNIVLPTAGSYILLGGSNPAVNAYIQESSSSIILGSANTPRMRIDTSGNVGIGVVPSAWTAGYRALEVGGFSLLNTNGDFSSTFIQSNAYYNGSWKYKTTGLASQFVQTSGFSTWSRAVSGTADAALTWIEDMRLDASGNLLVGCTSLPSSSVKGAGFTPTATGTDLYLGSNTTTGDNQIVFYNPNGLVGSISTSASVTQYNTSSDERLKENITDANDAGDKIDAIKVRQYDWKADGSHQDYGMVAQELMTVAPEAVSVPEDPEQMMGVDYSKLVPMMLKEIQSLRARISQLEGAN
jgi:hypothetical protein